MNRRNALRVAAGAIAAGGAGTAVLATAFKPEITPAKETKILPTGEVPDDWKYVQLDAETTANLAYGNYPKGSCMYGVFSSVIEQLAEQIGAPFSSFPVQMMKYGHGGIGGYGTTCGALNGAAALIGLLVPEKTHQNLLITELYQWYEKTPIPAFTPASPAMDYTPAPCISESVLCHPSTTRWSAEAGFRIDSKERKERCRRSTADVAARTVEVLNQYFSAAFVAHAHDNEENRSCMTCHSSEGKVGNTSSQMSCSSCHDKSVGHTVFGDMHYKLMKE